jgi:hypothetical protein
MDDKDDQDDQDRAVSRRVDNPTDAAPDDEAVYRAADPLPDDGHATGDQPETTGSTTEAAAAELAQENESEPQRSE